MTLGLALGLVLGLGWVPLFLFRAEALGAALPAYTYAERRWVQLTPTLLAIHMTAACVAINLTPRISVWSATCVLVTFGGAIVFWFWGRLMIGPLRVRRLPDEPPRLFRRSGAFAIVRHPLYFSYMMAAAAPLFVARRPFLLVTYGLCVIALAVRAAQEERRLRAQLGAAYDAYCRDVKRLIPFVW